MNLAYCRLGIAAIFGLFLSGGPLSAQTASVAAKIDAYLAEKVIAAGIPGPGSYIMLSPDDGIGIVMASNWQLTDADNEIVYDIMDIVLPLEGE